MNHEPASFDTPDDLFASLEAEMIQHRPSLEAQRQDLEEIEARFADEWQETGLLRRIVDSLPSKALDQLGNAPSIHLAAYTHPISTMPHTSLDFVLRPNPNDVTVPDDAPALHMISVAEVYDDEELSNDERIAVHAPFTSEDALLLLRQANELQSLKDAGLLGDLPLSLGTITDTFTP